MILTESYLKELGWEKKGDVMVSLSTPHTPLLGWSKDILYINGHPMPFVVNTTDQISHLYSLITMHDERNTITNPKK